MTLDIPTGTDAVLTSDTHLIQSFANLHALKQDGARTAIVEASGAMVKDSEGNELIDGIGGLWCVNVGHGRPEIIDAITQQLKTLDYYSTFYNFTHPAAAALAEKVASLAPGQLNHVYFGNSGSVANDTAVRILHHYNNLRGKPQKKKILSRMGAYHGSTHMAMALTTPAYSDGWGAVEGLVTHLRAPHKYREAPELSDEEFLKLLEQDMLDTIHRIGADNICAFFAEPIQGAGGVITAPPGYHKRMREITAQHDIAYVADEVVTAWGRLGHMFASKDAFDYTPDIITTAKGLTSGYQPLSATIISSEIHEVISRPEAMFLHGMTYSGHPAAAAAGLANIAILENEGIPARVQTTGKLFENTLRGLGDMAMVGEVRGSHFMMGIEFVKDKATREEFAPDANIGGAVAQAAQQRGLIARALGNILILSPTLIMDEAMITDIGAILRDSIGEVSDSLGL
ncbi:aminotransferase class III-fold pyridoxal phosphate-dependent enzyme [Rhodalgimonas zhirmunskyi]|uniref:Aminotransferase class III-fold pyridoxal phosphate-dependent enzyme n=1 Tax=Rhodalgimonas zhirmunskyi TaxID=2964767 RepID=A0AAJ1UGZ2_9RHOB|nr:aminotransferase class III-fold pyridoxal phosphate-dependent enzyme [Rhodoalgimonas zhirmunskyi]MDQ2095906.1 aminotransferase class III-fold pyridoxal phosphate-dependent enzyme [Rhodoalgimonas zhirmunskyi]